jgi:threonylcarbamoyladenosine tRNA methylthiotransferase MtaB
VVREALKHNPNAYVVVIGCYAQLKPNEIAQIPGVDMVLGAAEKFELISHLHTLVKEPKAVVHNAPIKDVNTFVPGYSLGDRTRIFLKVQDGCDYFCSFCTIPLARGKSRSGNVAETIELVKEAAQQGAKEIVLTGVNLGDFGIEHNQNFFDLVKAIDVIEGVDRYRISSIEPNLLTDEIIEFVAQSKRFVPHFHIPLQSGSDEILMRMRRKYLSDLYQSRIQKIKALMPHCGIGVDVIVGFPGETEENFLETYRFLNELDVSYLHVFPYSERANTTAKKMKDVVPVKVRMERGEMLRGLSEKKRLAFYREHLGTRRPVLFEEEERRGVMFGFTDNYIKVATDYDPLLVNTVSEVTLSSLDSEGWVNAAFDYAEVAH